MLEEPTQTTVGVIATAAIVVLGWLTRWMMGRYFDQFDQAVAQLNEMNSKISAINATVQHLDVRLNRIEDRD